MTFDADLKACAAIVEKADPDRFAAAMASPLEARKVLFPLYAFNVEVSRAPWVTQEAMIAEMRLQWWRDALEEIEKGEHVRRHDVVTPLSRVITHDMAPVLDRMADARRWDIYKDAFETAGHFANYIMDTAGGLMWIAARTLGQPENADVEKHVRAVGYATGLARFFQAVPQLEAQRRIPLVDGRAEAIQVLAREALERCPSRSSIKALLVPKARPAITEAFCAQTILKQVVTAPQLVAEGQLSVGPLRRSLLLWRWA